MRPVILFFVFTLLTSCERKEVKLSLIDTFTRGKKKEWLIVENYIKVTDSNGIITEMNVTEEEACYRDDTAVFSKGEEGETKLIPIYIWKKNQNTCSGIDEDLRMYFFLSDDMKSITFSDQDDLTTGTGDIWDIDKAENTEIIISQGKGTNNERRLRFTPKSETLAN